MGMESKHRGGGMRVVVEGVAIELTPEQVSQIEKVRQERKECRDSFEKMLLHFKFKKISKPSTDAHESVMFSHCYYNWYAEIHYGCGTYYYVWMTGNGLKNSKQVPGGWTYDEPEEIEREIVRALDENQYENMGEDLPDGD